MVLASPKDLGRLRHRGDAGVGAAVDLIVFAILFVVGYFAGRWNEKRHYASIRVLVFGRPR